MALFYSDADAKINTGNFFFEKENANLSTRQINQLYSSLFPALAQLRDFFLNLGRRDLCSLVFSGKIGQLLPINILII